MHARTQRTDSAGKTDRNAGLHYRLDNGPGYSRQRWHGKFRYLDQYGQPLREAKTLARIAGLGIPPAWQSVWICPDADGHLQATGRDARGRKQYRYHPGWQALRDRKKFIHMLAFGRQLPRIRQQVADDLRSAGLKREKVLALLVQLLEHTLIRVGNDTYAKHYHSFGLTTLHHRHVVIEDADILFHFRGKSGVLHKVNLHDRRLARMLRQLQKLPGQHLFQYADEQGQLHAIDAKDVNTYLHHATGSDYTAKDFRTWYGSLHTLLALRACSPVRNTAEARRNVQSAIAHAADRLGNSAAICRHSYVHPRILERYLSGMPLQSTRAADPSLSTGLSQAEQDLLYLLQET